MDEPNAAVTAGLALDGQGPLYEQIRRAIEERVLSGAWAPGTRVPPEHQLMELFAASRMTVHRALTALAEEGVVERRRRTGTVVAQPLTEHPIVGILSIPEEVERSGRTHSFRLLHRRIGRAARLAVRWLDTPPPGPLLHLHLLHLADGVPHAFEDRLIHLASVPAARDADFAQTPPGTWLLHQATWSEADHTIGAVGATAVEAQRLAIPVGEPCLEIVRRTWLQDHEVTRVRLLYPGERHLFRQRFGPFDSGPRRL